MGEEASVRLTRGVRALVLTDSIVRGDIGSRSASLISLRQLPVTLVWQQPFRALSKELHRFPGNAAEAGILGKALHRQIKACR